MTRQGSTSSVSPSGFIIGAPVTAENAQEVIEQANWTFANRPQVHLNLTTGGAGWHANAPYTHKMLFRASGSGFVEVYRFRIRILPETVNVICGAECLFGSGVAGEVKFTIGSGTVTITADNSHNASERTGTIAAASISGWQTVTVEIQTTSGAAGGGLQRIRVQDEAQAAYPAPVE